LAAAVVGCGGAGRAAAVGLAAAGARVTLFNRGIERGLKAAAELGLPFRPLSDLDPGQFDLLVHATPRQQRPGEPLPLDVERLRPGTVVVDMTYGEAPTALLEAAAARGALAVDGREVLLAQALAQFRAMTGRELPREVGRRALGLGLGSPPR
ncbi:MAG TPA: shikimate dehydrogenase, partial [Thermoanaerobaculia bacterium]|nr:shikimate dehydrogenase [Thermoanaerobaculia bacterium]